MHVSAPGLDTPRLFCDFPLLGTESFPFPAIINNPNFNPTDARDGIFLTQTLRFDPQIDENRRIVKEAASLYLSLLKYAADNSWQNLHLLAAVGPIPSELRRWVDPSWYQNEVLKPLRSALLRTNVVRTAKGTLINGDHPVAVLEVAKQLTSDERVDNELLPYVKDTTGNPMRLPDEFQFYLRVMLSQGEADVQWCDVENFCTLNKWPGLPLRPPIDPSFHNPDWED